MELVGRTVKKEILGFGILSGTVKSYDPFTGFFEILYEDGDSEEMEFMELCSILEGEVEPGVSQPIQEKRTWRKPKKRRREELLRDGSGNSTDNLMEDCCSREGFEESQMKHGLIHVGILETLEKETCSIIENLNEDVCFDENLKENGAFDGNLKGTDANMLVEETHKKEHSFDLNLSFNVEIEGTQMMELGIDGESKNVVSIGAIEEIQVNANGGFSEYVMEDACVVREEEIQNGDKVLHGDSKGNAFEVCEPIHIKDIDSGFHMKPSVSDLGLSANHGDGTYLGSPDKEEHGRKKRIKLSEKSKSTTRTALRRSTRRASATFSPLDHASSAENSVLVDADNAASFSHEIKVESDKTSFGLNGERFGELVDLPPKLELPPSSKNLDVDEIPIIDLFSVYACLRSFSTLLFLSPFDLEAFVGALRYKFPNSLIDSIHFSILQTLKLQLEFLSNEGSSSASDCLRSLNWGLLDLITWPIYMAEYLLICGSHLKPGFQLSHLNILNGDYYKQSTSIKLEILRCLCDDVLEAESVRSELNRRVLTMASELDTDLDSNANHKIKKRRKDQMDNGVGSCLMKEVVDVTADWNSDECCLCKMDGSLICCDGCPAAYHTKCVGITKDLLPEGDWFCPECVINRSDLRMKSTKYLRGADLLGIDRHGRLYFGSCGYLLVSDSCEPESSYCYYNRNDLNAILEVLRSSYTLYGGIISAICVYWDIPVVSTESKPRSDPQFKSVHKDLDMDGQVSSVSLSSVALSPAQIIEVKVEAKHESFVINEDVGHQSCMVLEPVSRSDSVAVDQVIETSNLFASSQPIECSLNQKNGADCSNMSAGTSNRLEIVEETHSTAVVCSLEPTDSDVKLAKNIGINPRKGAPLQMPCDPVDYVNYYTFAQSAASVAEELMHKSSDKKNEDSEKSVEDIISAQMVAIFKKSTNFCWSAIERPQNNGQKENCGWCFPCRTPTEDSESGDCLFNMPEKKLASEDSKIGAVGLRSKRNRKSHLFAIIYHILSIEERLSGLLSGPWQNPLYSKHWRRSILKASDVSLLKHLLLILESNLRHVALSAEWFKHVDSVVTMGSAAHVLTNSVRVSSSKHGSGRKRARFSDADSNSRSNASSRAGVFWWRGGRLSGQLFNWKVLPHSLASKGARQAGCRKILGVFYPDGSEFAKRSKYISWRASVEMSTSVPQLACQIRELDSNIRWDNLENIQNFSHLTKEAKKLTRQFKKVIVRRKCIEGTAVKYLLDFGKRRSIPDTVIRNGVIEISPNEKKKFWLGESHVPLHLLKAFEERKLARKSKKKNSGLPDMFGKVTKKSSRKKGLLCLLSKGEKSEYNQCGHCNKDVLIRDAVNCQDCKGFFHKRHVRKSERTTSADCIYTCHKCHDKKHSKKLVKPKTKKGKIQSQKKLVVQSQKKLVVKSQKKVVVQSQKIKKTAIEGRPKRLVKKVNYAPLKRKTICRAKKGKQVQSRKGEPKKTKKSICWCKRNRTQVNHAYWLNGLRLTRKPNDARVMHFRERKLLLSTQHSSANFMQPICCLCSEAAYRSELTYISCENCQEWFHGDAFGLTAENSDNILGFRCHKCRKRNPPVCPHLQDAAVSDVEMHPENDAGIEYVKDISVIDELPSEKYAEEKSSPNEDSLDSLHGYEADEILDSNHKEQTEDKLPDSKYKEQKADSVLDSNQIPMLGEFKRELEKGLETVHADQKADKTPDSDQTHMSE